jgi:hypothetical protein
MATETKRGGGGGGDRSGATSRAGDDIDGDELLTKAIIKPGSLHRSHHYY